MIPDFCSTNAVSAVCGRREGWRRALRCLLIGLLLVTAPGCNYMLLLGYLIGGPPQEEPQQEEAPPGARRRCRRRQHPQNTHRVPPDPR